MLVEVGKGSDRHPWQALSALACTVHMLFLASHRVERKANELRAE